MRISLQNPSTKKSGRVAWFAREPRTAQAEKTRSPSQPGSERFFTTAESYGRGLGTNELWSDLGQLIARVPHVPQSSCEAGFREVADHGAVAPEGSAGLKNSSRCSIESSTGFRQGVLWVQTGGRVLGFHFLKIETPQMAPQRAWGRFADMSWKLLVPPVRRFLVANVPI